MRRRLKRWGSLLCRGTVAFIGESPCVVSDGNLGCSQDCSAWHAMCYTAHSTLGNDNKYDEQHVRHSFHSYTFKWEVGELKPCLWCSCCTERFGTRASIMEEQVRRTTSLHTSKPKICKSTLDFVCGAGALGKSLGQESSTAYETQKKLTHQSKSIQLWSRLWCRCSLGCLSGNTEVC